MSSTFFEQETDMNIKVNEHPAGGRFIAKPEILKRLGMSRPTLMAWERNGKLPPFLRIGSKAGYSEATIETILAGQWQPKAA